MTNKRWRNIDKNDKPVKKGTKVRFVLDVIDEIVTLKYNNRLGWHYFSERHGQDFIMPTEYRPGKVNMFHRCEVVE